MKFRLLTEETRPLSYRNGGVNETRKKELYLSVLVFSTKVIIIGDTIFMSPTGDGIAILRGHPSHAKV